RLRSAEAAATGGACRAAVARPSGWGDRPGSGRGRTTARGGACRGDAVRGAPGRPGERPGGQGTGGDRSGLVRWRAGAADHRGRFGHCARVVGRPAAALHARRVLRRVAGRAVRRPAGRVAARNRQRVRERDAHRWRPARGDAGAARGDRGQRGAPVRGTRDLRVSRGDVTGVRRSSAGSVLFSTYNMLDLSSSEGSHYAAVIEVIRSLGTDVLAVQEILAPDPDTAAERLRRLAADTGMHCDAPSGGVPAPALAFGGHGYHVGLLWRDGIEPLPDSLRCHGGRDFWHGLAQVTLDV